MAYDEDVERWVGGEGGRVELFDQLARLHRIVVGRCYISRYRPPPQPENGNGR